MNDNKRAEFFLKCRKKKHLSQEKLGEMINYSRNNISKWERGISFPSDPNVLEKLAKIFDVSIEELMYGEYKNSTNEKDIIKNLTDEYKNKYKKSVRKNILIFSLIIIIVLIIIYFVYLIFIRGTIKIYKVSIDDPNFILDDSILFTSNSISILNFNKVSSKNNEDIKYVELYYYDNNEKKIIDGSANDVKYIRETNGYDEYDLKNLINKNIYLYIKTDDNEYKDIEVYFIEEYVNNNIFPKKVPKISDESSNVKYNFDSEFANLLLKDGFETTDNIDYEKRFNDNVLVLINTNSIYIYIHNKDENSDEIINAFFEGDKIFYTKLVNGKDSISYDITTEETKNCNIDKCDTAFDYALYINYFKNLYLANK